MKLPSPAMFVSIAALVVALGGTSYAAVTINGKDIKAKSIDSSRIKSDALGSGVIKDGKVKQKDLAVGAGDTRWAYVGADGVIQAQSGGFTMVAAYPTLPNTAAAGTADNSLRANGNVYIDAGVDLGGTAITATLVLQNTVDQDTNGMAGRTPGSDTNAEFSGEITVSRCNVGAPPAATGPTNCAPTGAQNLNSFVVSPRLSDGQPTGLAGANNRKGFYVTLSK